ncbi:MAG: NAD(P) transhydrogenase subunit alpha, partial [Chloroflexia bacterium]|nr:NAD(P) transhydrogenase subunit alpha [Chloroflexia bacterium]
MDQEILLGAYVFLLAIFLGVEIINRVPATLHTPLMSGTNAIHGIVLLGAMIVIGTADTLWLQAIGFVAVITGAINVVGGFVVTD